MHKQLPVMVLMGASMLWGLSWLPLKGINAMGIEGISLIFASYGILSLAFTPWLLRQMKTWKEHKKALLLIALLGGGASLCFTYALINGEVIRVMVLFYLLPLWGVLGGRFFLKEEIDRWRWLGVVLALAGAFLILGGFDVLGGEASWIDLIALLSGLLFSLNNLVFRAAQEVSVTSKIGAMFYGCFALAALLLVVGAEAFPSDISGSAWSALILYAFFWLLVANAGSQWSVTHMEAGRSSIIIILELITAVLSATLIAGESMSVTEYVGGALIVSAAFIEALRTKEETIPKTTL
jgi:drug/metabolite transporter (DMT)-like permease